jgi:hypothetical protein
LGLIIFALAIKLPAKIIPVLPLSYFIACGIPLAISYGNSGKIRLGL